MIEWRDTEDLPEQGGRDEYIKLSSESVVVLTERLDTLFQVHVKDAIGGERRDESYEDGTRVHTLAYKYDDIGLSAYNEPVVTQTAFTLEHSTFKTGSIRELYEVSVTRQVLVELQRAQLTDDSTYILTERFVQGVFLERYTLAMNYSDEQAYVDQIDLTTEHGEMRKRPMTLYDATQLVMELDKISSLNEVCQKESATIEW